MASFESKDPSFETRVRQSFARQGFMAAIGATMTRVSPGEVDIEVPFRSDLTQQHGYMHGGVVTAIVDSACGYAALSLMSTGTEVLTVEYKVNFLAPGQRGSRMIACGRVTRPGRTITVSTGDVFAVDGEARSVRDTQQTLSATRD